MSVPARVLRLDRDRWLWLRDDAGPGGAGAIVLGAYLLLAFSRFGWTDFAIRPTTRFMLTGFYGWLWLAVSAWLVARVASRSRVSLFSVIRLTGHAHVPLLLLAVLIQLVSVALNFTDAAHWPAVFVGSFWLPAQLAQAVATASGLSLRRAVLVAVGPYLLWVAVVGRHLWLQVGHLL